MEKVNRNPFLGTLGFLARIRSGIDPKKKGYLGFMGFLCFLEFLGSSNPGLVCLASDCL